MAENSTDKINQRRQSFRTKGMQKATSNGMRREWEAKKAKHRENSREKRSNGEAKGGEGKGGESGQGRGKGESERRIGKANWEEEGGRREEGGGRGKRNRKGKAYSGEAV